MPQRFKQPGYGPSGLKDEQHMDGKNARQISDWLDNKAHGDKPFFMACGIQKPHVPFLAPDKYFDLYPKAELKFTAASPEFWNTVPQIAQTKRYEGFGFELSTTQVGDRFCERQLGPLMRVARDRLAA